MPSPADRQVEANEDVERIARAYYEAADEIYSECYGGNGLDGWDDLQSDAREAYRECTRRLLLADVIRVGRRPNAERPMEGQTTIDDETGHLSPEDKAVGADGK